MTRPLELGPDAELAVSAARAAGDLVRGGFGGPLGRGSRLTEARRNGPHDVVTPLDAAAEELISEMLARARPGDGFVGEETVGRPATGTEPRRTWIVDPIDGTVSFVSGLPFFSVSVALLVGERVAAGVVHDPVHRETFVAAEGAGGWLIDDTGTQRVRPLKVRDLAVPADAVVSADPGNASDLEAVARVGALGARVRVVRTLGSTALSLAYLAAGRLDGVIQVRGLQAVDIAAGGFLAGEAGALVTDAAGRPWLDPAHLDHGRGIAAGIPLLHPVLLAS